MEEGQIAEPVDLVTRYCSLDPDGLVYLLTNLHVRLLMLLGWGEFSENLPNFEELARTVEESKQAASTYPANVAIR